MPAGRRQADRPDPQGLNHQTKENQKYKVAEINGRSSTPKIPANYNKCFQHLIKYIQYAVYNVCFTI